MSLLGSAVDNVSPARVQRRRIASGRAVVNVVGRRGRRSMEWTRGGGLPMGSGDCGGQRPISTLTSLAIQTT